jgi:hypothetical protein
MKSPTDPAEVEHPEPEVARELRSEGNQLLGAGVGIGAMGLAGGVLLGAVCPLCVVFTPALLGAGVYKRLRARRVARRPSDDEG